MTAVEVLVEGEGRGDLLRLEEPLSFWGGVDPETGAIVDATHPQYGNSVAGRVMAMPHGRGSSSSSSVLAELLRLGAGPAALVLDEPDSILVVGVLVARSLYGSNCPVIVADPLPESAGTWDIRDGLLTGPDDHD